VQELPTLQPSGVPELTPEQVGELSEEVRELAAQRDAVILAHNYQRPEIQDVADHVGDSLALARLAASESARTIVLAGVYFMAETAKILSPQRTVLIPDANAGCSLADSITAEQLREWKREHPGAVVVAYVNTSAEVKAESDVCCTSANAADIVAAIPAGREVLFLPDQFLGAHVRRVTGRENLHVWMGECHVHAGIRPEDIERWHDDDPDAELLVHPECGCASQAMAFGNERTHILSTEGMVNFAKQSSAPRFRVATETGTNSVIASCNLNRENMISALLGRDQPEGEKPSADSIKRHVMNLLEIAAPNAALTQHREHYQQEFENSTAPTND